MILLDCKGEWNYYEWPFPTTLTLQLSLNIKDPYIHVASLSPANFFMHILVVVEADLLFQLTFS